jgi:uncharacterized protein YkwD
VAGGAESQTTDTRRPSATISANSLEIHNSDDSLVVTASNLSAQASGSCDQNRVPRFASSGSPGAVTLNHRPIDTSRDYTEPGLGGGNGAPLFGEITIRFNEVTTSDTGITRNEIHVVVTDHSGAVVFEAVGGTVSAGRDGPVCDPPPVCPPGQEPQAGKCVDVIVTPLPPTPAPAPTPVPEPGRPPTNPTFPQAGVPVKTKGCRDVNAQAGRVPTRRLMRSTLCLLNNVRRGRHLPRLRLNAELSAAATRQGRDMLKRRYFAHEGPSGPTLTDRILRSGYLRRFGAWTLGENIGWGWRSYGTPRAIVAGWMRSPGHRRNIVSRKFRDIGIAVIVGDPLGHRRKALLYVTDFGGFRSIH